nr:hypothetical protein [Tanacetum cinerariifolium]
MKIEIEQLIEAQQVSYVEAINAKEAEEKENLEKVKKSILVEVDKIVEGDEEEVDETFSDSFVLSQEDLSTRIYTGSHKKSLEEEKEEEEEDNYVDIALIRKRRTCILENREETTSVTDDFRSLVTSELATLLLVISKNFYKAALAILITGASPTRQHGMSELVSYDLTD